MRDVLTLRTLLEVINQLKRINYVLKEFDTTLFNSIKRTNFDTFMGVGGRFWKMSILKSRSCLLISHSKGIFNLIFGNVEIWVLQRILHWILILNRKNIDFVFQSYSQLMLQKIGVGNVPPYFVILENQLKSYNYQNRMMQTSNANLDPAINSIFGLYNTSLFCLKVSHISGCGVKMADENRDFSVLSLLHSDRKTSVKKLFPTGTRLI